MLCGCLPEGNIAIALQKNDIGHTQSEAIPKRTRNDSYPHCRLVTVFAATNNILLKTDRHGDDILNIHTTSMLETSGPQDQSFF